MVSASATNAGAPRRRAGRQASFHRVLPDDAAQAAGIIKYLETDLQPATIALVHDNSEYGKGLADQIAGQLAGRHRVVAQEAIDPESEDFSAAVNAVNAADPDVIFYGGYYEEAGQLKKQLADAGVEAQFISGDGALDVGFIDAAGDAADGAILSCPCYFASPEAEGRRSPSSPRPTRRSSATRPAPTPPRRSTPPTSSSTASSRGTPTVRRSSTTSRASPTVDDAISKEVVFEENGNIEAQGIFLFEVNDGAITLRVATDDL